MGAYETSFNGIATVCDPFGRIRQVLRNDLSETIALPSEGSLTSIVDESSMQKFFTFMYRLREEKALYDWSINVRGLNKVIELYFVGGMNRDEMLIVASTSKKVAGSYFEDVMRVNNEQTNLIRTTMKHQLDKSSEPFALQENKRSSRKDAVRTENEFFEDFSRLNNELANLQRNLQKKNRMLEETLKERNTYLGIAAHDLRNPLSGISNLSSLLAEGEFGELNEEQQESLEMIRDSAEHMLELVSDVLDLSKYESGTLYLKWKEADLIETVKRSLAMNTPHARKKGIEIGTSFSVDSLPILIDRLKITQVIDNLLSNAVKYSQSQSAVTLRVYTQDAFAFTEVEDEGQGIPEGELAGIFEPFYQSSVATTAGEKSTGLGLAITRRIVEGHGGTIEVKSKQGEGSLFRFSIPLRP